MILGFDRLRNATEEDVKGWLKAAFTKLPIETPAEMTELLHRIAEMDDGRPTKSRN